MLTSPTTVEATLLEFPTIDQMEQELTRLEGLISRVRARQLEILAVADHLQLPTWDGTRSLKEWIAGRLDISPRNAADLAVLAKAQPSPILDSHTAGLTSTDRAAATVRLANAGVDQDTIDQADGIAVGQIGRLAARHQRMTPLDETKAFRMRRVWYQPNLGSTLAIGTFATTGADMEAIIEALDMRADDIIEPNSEHRPSLEQRRMDALVSLALDATTPHHGDKVAPRRLKAHIYIDAALTADTGGEAGASSRSGIKVGPNTLAEILCVGETQTTVIDIDGLKPVPTNGDRIPNRIREYIFYRDGGCTADGCTSRYRLEPHHIRHRTHGGDDDPDGLALLCWFHHHIVVHQMGFTIDPDSPPGRRRFLPPRVSGDPPPG